ncbi:MAG: hypothetical protein RIE24_10255 [Silicimonas sp.]
MAGFVRTGDYENNRTAAKSNSGRFSGEIAADCLPDSDNRLSELGQAPKRELPNSKGFRSGNGMSFTKFFEIFGFRCSRNAQRRAESADSPGMPGFPGSNVGYQLAGADEHLPINSS